jgi:carboxypeptidase C (cathepsin A)
MRVLIYNGDADACVPYKGNEEWTEAMVDKGAVTEKKAWHPWFVAADKSGGTIPAGYATSYDVSGNAPSEAGSGAGFTFITIRLAGHMVPAFQPEYALGFFQTFLANGEF